MRKLFTTSKNTNSYSFLPSNEGFFKNRGMRFLLRSRSKIRPESKGSSTLTSDTFGTLAHGDMDLDDRCHFSAAASAVASGAQTPLFKQVASGAQTPIQVRRRLEHGTLLVNACKAPSNAWQGDDATAPELETIGLRHAATHTDSADMVQPAAEIPNLRTLASGFGSIEATHPYIDAPIVDTEALHSDTSSECSGLSPVAAKAALANNRCIDPENDRTLTPTTVRAQCRPTVPPLNIQKINSWPQQKMQQHNDKWQPELDPEGSMIQIATTVILKQAVTNYLATTMLVPYLDILDFLDTAMSEGGVIISTILVALVYLKRIGQSTILQRKNESGWKPILCVAMSVAEAEHPCQDRPAGHLDWSRLCQGLSANKFAVMRYRMFSKQALLDGKSRIDQKELQAFMAKITEDWQSKQLIKRVQKTRTHDPPGMRAFNGSALHCDMGGRAVSTSVLKGTVPMPSVLNAPQAVSRPASPAGNRATFD